MFAGGQANTIDYITMASAGNATDFGDLTASRSYHGSLSNKTNGVFPGGISSNTTIDFITIASTVMLVTLEICCMQGQNQHNVHLTLMVV